MDSIGIAAWLDSLAAKQPTPGGGAVAALSAAIAAAQLEMVAAYTTGSKWQDREARMNELSAELAKLRSNALELVKSDAEAFAEVGSAYGLPKETDSEKAIRKTAIQKALKAAAQPPMRTAKLSERLAEIATEISTSGNPNVISDVAVGASLAKASLESAIANIEINQHALEDTEAKKLLHAAVQDAQDAIQDADAVIETVRDQMEPS